MSNRFSAIHVAVDDIDIFKGFEDPPAATADDLPQPQRTTR